MKIKGFTYGYLAKHGVLLSEEGFKSRERLFETGINWMCLAFAMNQDTYCSTEIRFDFSKSVSDYELVRTIEHAHNRGIKVCLKPMVNCSDGMWRARIDFPDDSFAGENHYWNDWFDSYTGFMLYYAEIAERTGCEMLCIGCEMCGTERKTSFWRTLISKIRNVYHGPLVYNTNHGRENTIEWWDAVDYIGTSAYYPVRRSDTSDKASMIEEWKKISKDLEEVSKRFGKNIIFMEIGCRSAKGCAAMPWDFQHRELPVDEREQADFYDSCLSVFFDKSWMSGIFWWDWSPVIYSSVEEAHDDKGFNIYLKKAEGIIRKWYKQDL